MIFLLMARDSIPQYEQLLERTAILFTVEGRPSWKLIADRIYDFGNLYKVYNLTVFIFDGEGSQSQIVADSGWMDKNSGNMEAFGEVVVETSDGTVLRTDHLVWDERGDRIYTEDTVLIISRDKVLRGIGFESDPSLKKITIKRNVYGEGREGIVR